MDSLGRSLLSTLNSTLQVTARAQKNVVCRPVRVPPSGLSDPAGNEYREAVRSRPQSLADKKGPVKRQAKEFHRVSSS